MATRLADLYAAVSRLDRFVLRTFSVMCWAGLHAQSEFRSTHMGAQ